MSGYMRGRIIMEIKNFAWPVTSVDKGDYIAFCNWFDEHRNMLSENQIIIWGAGIRGTEFALFLKQKNFTNILFTDSNRQKWGGYIDEFPIISPDEISNEKARKILISTENSETIEKELETRGYYREQDFFTIKTYLYEKYVSEFQRKYGSRYLFMGDCEFSTIAISDTDYSTLSELLQERLGKENTKVLAMHGMGLRAYYNIFMAQVASGMKPESLLVMVNLDTLTGMQHLLPRSQHAELIKMIYDITPDAPEEFKEYLQIVNERSKKIQVEFFTAQSGKEKATTEAKSKNYFRLNYLYRLNPEVEGLIYLDKILREALQMGIKVLPFIPPVNYELAQMLFGEKFRCRYDENIRKIQKIVQNRGCDLLDLSYSLTADMFAEPTTPDETANDRGRKKLAVILADRAKRM